MSKIPFTVSARTARLIGRENVANAEGALIELVKNCYDADAKKCIVYFDNKYQNIPDTLNLEEFHKLSAQDSSKRLLEKSYAINSNEKKFYLSNSLTDKNHEL